MASLAGLAHGMEGLAQDAAAVQIREVRLLAAAAALAEKTAAGSPAKVREQDMVLRSISAELGGIMRVADRTMQRRIDEARTIVEDYPTVLDAWEAGRIVRGHVLTIVAAGSIVPPELREQFADAAISQCERDTPNRVRPALELLAQHLHPRSFAERHEEAAAGRCVRIVPGADGMSELIAKMPTAIAEGVHDRLTQMGRAIIDTRGERAVTGDAEIVATDARTMDQVRADLLADLLLAGTPALDDTKDTTAGPLGKIRARI